MAELYQHVTANHRQLKPYEFSREILLQAYLIENTEILDFNKDVFGNAEFLAEELYVENLETHSGNGRLDILASYSEGFLGVFELKKGKLVRENLTQLKAYVTKENREKIVANPIVTESQGKQDSKNFIAVLVGTSIDPSLAAIILEGEETDDEDHIPIAAIVIKRYKSDKDIFVISESYYQETKSKKDYTKYILDDDKENEYGKGPLVLAVVKKYVQQNPSVNLLGLQKVFRLGLGGWNVRTIELKSVGDRIREDSKSKKARHFLKDPIDLCDGTTVVVNNQWGKDNMLDFFNLAKKLNFKITKVK